MEYEETELFGEVTLPKTINEIINLISIHAKTKRNLYLWRGQGNIDWRIDSSAYRRLNKNADTITEDEMQSYEKHLLSHATHSGYRFENGRVLSDFELLAKLQHHGAATRLVDCSRNVLVALWFTCASEKNKIGLLFGIHSDSLGGMENKTEDRTCNEIFEHLAEYNHPQVWHPPVVTTRIAAQNAQFLYSKVSTNEMGSLSIDPDPETFIAIGILPELKSKLLEELSNTFDIRYLTLFPDIDGFGYANSVHFYKFESERW